MIYPDLLQYLESFNVISSKTSVCSKGTNNGKSYSAAFILKSAFNSAASSGFIFPPRISLN